MFGGLMAMVSGEPLPGLSFSRHPRGLRHGFKYLLGILAFWCHPTILGQIKDGQIHIANTYGKYI